MPESESTLRTYILNTSFHGFKFIAEQGNHWTERIFWAVCCCLSWYASGLLIQAAWDDFQNNAISFVVETNYLEWDTKFPSIVVCETDNQDRIAKYTDRVLGPSHDYNLEEIVKELVYYKGFSFYTLQFCGPDAPVLAEHCFENNFSSFSVQVRAPCSEIFKLCRWNALEFDCCEYFTEMDSELGLCYAVNSVQTRNQKSPKFPMVSNKQSGPGSLHLKIMGFANVYLLAEQEVPSLTTLATDIISIYPHISYHRQIALKEIENQPEVKDVSVQQRKCRFTFENDMIEVYHHYSYSSCHVQCRKNEQLKICGCVHHAIPNTATHLHCDLKGLSCLTKHYNELTVMKAYWSNRSGLYCDCWSSCTEFEMTIIKDDKVGISEEHAEVQLSLERLPSEKYKRNVVRGKLDLVVSMGGTTALFLGASILSFVELIYYFTLRPFNNRLKRKKNKRNARKMLTRN